MPHPLEPLYRPKSIAVVGASSNPDKLGYVLLKNVIDYGYKGDLFPINPGGGEILGHKAFPSLKDVGKPVDLILISIPGPAVPGVIEEAGATKCKNAVVLSSGFGEMGGEGQNAQQAIEAVCRSTGLRVLGPNCMGVYNNTDDLNGTYFWELPRIKGSVSFISQSGAFGGVMFNEIRAREMGVSKFFSIGNQVDITHADLLEALVKDKDTGVVGLFIEGIKDGDRFLKALEAFTADRPVVAFKGGKTEAGVRAAASHTGSMAGSYAVYKSALEAAGAIVAEDSEEFFDSLMALSMQKPPRGKRVTIMTISGGPCVVAGDNCERLGIEVPQLSDDLQKGILELTPPFAAPSNPVDMTPQMSPPNFIPCVDLVVKQDNVDGVIAINVGLDYAEFAQAFIDASRKYDKPVTSFTIDTPVLTGLFKEAGVPIYPTPERAVTAYNALVRFAFRPQYHRYSEEIVPKPPSRTLMDFLKEHDDDVLAEHYAKKSLTEYGVPVVDEKIVKIWSATLTAAEDIGYPLVLKLHSSLITHKTEAGAVFLNIQNEDELRKAWESLNHEFPADDYVLQRMVPAGHELIVGAKRDAAFGPVVAVGLGGVFTEIFEDISLGVCPVVETQARAMLASLKSHKILQGYRNLPAIDEEKLIGVVLSVSDFMLANPNVTELDLNPLIAREDSLVAVDALIKVLRE
jgi:acetyltransferase